MSSSPPPADLVFSSSKEGFDVAIAVSALGKDKLAVLLRQQGETVSTSMVGRILNQLKGSGQLAEPLRRPVPGSRRRLRPRPYAVRKPKQYAVSQPGDLVQVDTLDVRRLPGVVFKQFTARDVVSRWDVIQAHGRATAQSATQFLETLLHRMPFPIRALQVDGGSEFAAEFELACQQRGLHLFVLPPRSPKLNGAVERANRTHTDLTSLWATSLPISFSASSHPSERNESVTHLLDEYAGFSPFSANDMMEPASERCAAPSACTTLLSSSMAEHPAVNRRVVGSSPT